MSDPALVESRARSSLCTQDGQDLVETALTMPVFLLLLIGIIEFGFILFAYNSVANVAREGARFGVIAGRTEAEIESHVRSHAPGIATRCRDFEDMGVTTDLSDPNLVAVEVLCNWPLLSGDFIGTGPEITLRAVSSMRRE